MAGIIKAHQHEAVATGVAFNFDDMTDRAQQYLARVRGQAAQMVAEAQQKATQIRQGASHEGQTEAVRLAEETIGRRVGQQLESLLPALEEAVAQIEQSRQAWLRQWETNIVHLACAIAARIIRREIGQDPAILGQFIGEALELAAGSAKIRVLLNPLDYHGLEGNFDQLTAPMATLGEAEFVADSAVTVGGCRVETRFGTIDQQIEAQLARIEEELT